MDIASLKPSERKHEMLHPGTNELLEISVSLMSLNDDRMKPLRRRIQDRRLNLERRGKTFSAEEIEENKKEVCFGAMTGWDFYGKEASFNGAKPEFNRANVFNIFNSLPWFQDQINDALGEDKDFFHK